MADAVVGESRKVPLLDTNEITTMISPSLDAMGYRLVRVAFTGGRRPTLQVMAERRDDAPMTVDDCAEISHSISALLDVADPIPTEYQLEVSSPGIDRPLISREDFVRFAGYEAKIEVGRMIDGRKRFRGRVLGLSGDDVRLALPDAEVTLPFVDIVAAKLLLTDELLAAAAKMQQPN
ncbi:MAG: rimP [Rhodospirillales bacterium]|jgi:ribosome maturation factor RimP|nr:rimP [Rhodospirillales bacterium]